MESIKKVWTPRRSTVCSILRVGLVASMMVLPDMFRFGARRTLSNVMAFQGVTRRIPPIRNRISLPSSSSTSIQMELMDTAWNSQCGDTNKEAEDVVKRIPTNQELVERRLAVNRAKRESRERSVQQRVSRNFQVKRLLHSGPTRENNNDDNYNDSGAPAIPVPPLYAVKVWVDDELRETLRLSAREKRGRVFIETGTEGTSTLHGLKGELFGFFRALRKGTFLLTASLPRLSLDGTMLSPENIADAMNGAWSISTDDDVRKTFRMADQFFRNSTMTNGGTAPAILKRPSIQINVLKDQNAPPPPPIPSYLVDMPNPVDSESMTMLSFYAFPPSGIANPEAFALDLKGKWKPFQALGRIYVAQEGVNAQMSVPTNVLPNFMNCCRAVPELGQYMENDINIDPIPLSKGEFAVAGVPINGKPAPPFRNLHVRVRNQVVADGLDKFLDWQSAGYDMPPLEWHEKIKEARENKNRKVQGHSSSNDVADLPIVLDCRNTYETDVGIFEGAEPLGTENFRESWDVLRKRLADTPKDAPIMTYCTGGIRCVKVGAYLTQELGFTNVSRLAGGIIGYDRLLNEKKKGEKSMFKGTNFVFDGRLGRQITEDALGTCVTCGAETSLVSNCRNDNCHKRIVQCESCRTGFSGTCSTACKNRVLNGSMAPRRLSDSPATSVSMTGDGAPSSDGQQSPRYNNLDEYSLGHSSPVPSIYKEIELNTQAHLATGSHMVSGASQGRLLTQLASMTRTGRILELGTFTAYATACLLEGARNVGQILGVSNSEKDSGGPYVLTMERDGRAFSLAAAHLRIISKLGFGADAAEAACALRSQPLDDVEDALVSVTVEDIVTCNLLRVSDALATVESIAGGINDSIYLPHPFEPFDLVFVDADKTRLLEYIETCLSSDRLLRRGGLIVVDNVLWKGLVLEARTGEFTSVQDHDGTEQAEARKNRRARKLATTMHRFNEAIVKDERVEVLVLPIRDGLSVMRKK